MKLIILEVQIIKKINHSYTLKPKPEYFEFLTRIFDVITSNWFPQYTILYVMVNP